MDSLNKYYQPKQIDRAENVVPLLLIGGALSGAVILTAKDTFTRKAR